MGKLLCIFVKKEKLDDTIDEIFYKYNVLNNRVFVLAIEDSDEYVCTYNIDTKDSQYSVKNAMLVHRKTETSTLYTINSLNALQRSLQSSETGLDNTKIDWEQYRNSFLVTVQGELKVMKTILHSIITR
jgi:hypothetical protein